MLAESSYTIQPVQNAPIMKFQNTFQTTSIILSMIIKLYIDRANSSGEFEYILHLKLTKLKCGRDL
jgi:hypothetical protein